jgi:hypothetical protein
MPAAPSSAVSTIVPPKEELTEQPSFEAAKSGGAPKYNCNLYNIDEVMTDGQYFPNVYAIFKELLISLANTWYIDFYFNTNIPFSNISISQISFESLVGFHPLVSIQPVKMYNGAIISTLSLQGGNHGVLSGQELASAALYTGNSKTTTSAAIPCTQTIMPKLKYGPDYVLFTIIK